MTTVDQNQEAIEAIRMFLRAVRFQVVQDFHVGHPEGTELIVHEYFKGFKDNDPKWETYIYQVVVTYKGRGIISRPFQSDSSSRVQLLDAVTDEVLRDREIGVSLQLGGNKFRGRWVYFKTPDTHVISLRSD